MARQIERSRVESALEELSYPVMRSDAAAAFADATVTAADDDHNLGRLISETDSDHFDAPHEIVTELEKQLGDG